MCKVGKIRCTANFLSIVFRLNIFLAPIYHPLDTIGIMKIDGESDRETEQKVCGEFGKDDTSVALSLTTFL